MPGNNLSDMAFQPKTKGYSYSANNSPSKNNNNVYLISGIILLIVILLAAFLYLNNSGNIKTPAAKNTPPTNSLMFKTYTKLVNQATDAQMSSYIALINAKKIPFDDPNYPAETYGIFSGFDNKYIQVVTYSGIKKFPLTKNLNILLFGQPVKESTSSGATVGLTQIQKDNFFNKSRFGQVIKLTLVTPQAVQTIYLTE